MNESRGEVDITPTEKASILIVDDRPANLLVYRSALEDLGQNLVTAQSGYDALKHLLERDFAVILLDVNMPGMDGFETAAYIRGREKSAHTPIIFLTAYAEEMQSAKGYALGAVDCIVTPVIPEILRTKVQVFVQLYLMTRESERVQAERTTQEMIEALPNPIFFTGMDGRYRGVNKAWETFFGIPRTHAVGKMPRELFSEHKETGDWSHEMDRVLLLQPGTQTYEAVVPAFDGMLHNVVYYKATYAGPEGPVTGLIGTIVDITDRKRAEKRQSMEHAVTRVLADASTVDEAIARVIETICTGLGWHYGVWWHWHSEMGALHRRESWGIDAPEIRRFDEAIAQLHVEPRPDGKGLASRAFAARKPVWIVDIAKADAFKRQALAMEAGLHSGFAFPLMRGSQALGVIEFFHRDAGEPDPVLVKTAESIGSEIGQYLVRMHAEEAVKFMAMHDGLTRLPNRVMFNERLSGAIAQAQRYHRSLAVLFIDLDRFKIINDTLGHEAGDYVLREASQRLTENLRAGDTVARLGGDEFVVLLEQVVDPVYVASVCQKLIEALAAPFVIAGREYRITASIGVSTYPADSSDGEELLKNADIAMYRAKEQGRNAFEFFSPQIRSGALERLNLESGLRRALERDELKLYYQPQIETCTGRIVGMEALIRWQHAELGLLAPARFLKLAEENGLIVPIGEWVAHAACKAHREWQSLRLAPPRIAINLSPRQFLHAGLTHDMVRVLEQTGCKASYLELEITESMVMLDPNGAVGLIKELKEMGVRIAMDDFGTGYSSLAHLKCFPIDSLKIDRSFIADLPHDTGNAAITDAIIAMARTLHMTVIAEGVETRAQFEYLRRLGCDEVQGYYFSPPLAFDEATDLLRNGAMPESDPVEQEAVHE
ncbi:MAG TPA: EAL domain-containing protein [Burkholderiales bacterium]|nr:EAL domain-containing protein [Burkholderiales bacterium]